MAVKLESIHKDIVRVDAASTLADLKPALGERELLVEPLSATQSLADFLAEGGIGYGAANEGSFAASICRIKTDAIDYGSDHQALYNAGYPLQRMAEGRGALTEELGTARELALYVRPKMERVAVAESITAFPAEAPADAQDFVVVNAAAGQLMGLEGHSAVAVYPRELAPAEAPPARNFWAKRFIEDALAEAGNYTSKILTQRSAAQAAWEMAQAGDCIFFALFAYTGVLVVISGSHDAVEPIEKLLLNQPLTWKLGAAQHEADDSHAGH